MSTESFRTEPDAVVTPELAQAVGLVTLEWAMIQEQFGRSFALLWQSHHKEKKPPASFDKQMALWVALIETLFRSNPDYLNYCLDYVQRVRSANGQRDDIAHGVPGVIEKRGRSFFGLMVSRPLIANTRMVQIDVPKITAIAFELRNLKHESSEVYWQVGLAHNASLPDILVLQDSRRWVHPSEVYRTPTPPEWWLRRRSSRR
jgi:hypothetical protein